MNSIIEELKKLREEVREEIQESEELTELKKILKSYLGKNGQFSSVVKRIKEETEDERREIGRAINELREEIMEEWEEKKGELEDLVQGGVSFFDPTVPGIKPLKGHIHPLTQVKREMMDIFQGMGFDIAQGPEAETEWYNFDALNIPGDHPARDMWDTFWLKDMKDDQRLLLRTHTSPVQVRYMESHEPPYKVIVPGKVYRHEATDASHEFQLYQLEGLMIDKDISMGNLRAVLLEFFRRFLGDDVKIRLRPSFFPFTEPSCEVDVSCVMCKQEGCSLCSQTGWLEMAGAGMVHPNVLKNSGVDSEKYQGFAFGAGIDRCAMIKHKIPEIRWFHSGDLRFLEQF